MGGIRAINSTERSRDTEALCLVHFYYYMFTLPGCGPRCPPHRPINATSLVKMCLVHYSCSLTKLTSFLILFYTRIAVVTGLVKRCYIQKQTNSCQQLAPLLLFSDTSVQYWCFSHKKASAVCSHSAFDYKPYNNPSVFTCHWSEQFKSKKFK